MKLSLRFEAQCLAVCTGACLTRKTGLALPPVRVWMASRRLLRRFSRRLPSQREEIRRGRYLASQTSIGPLSRTDFTEGVVFAPKLIQSKSASNIPSKALWHSFITKITKASCRALSFHIRQSDDRREPRQTWSRILVLPWWGLLVSLHKQNPSNVGLIRQ